MRDKNKLGTKIEAEAEKLSAEIVEEMQFPEKSENPIILVFGGFQGSGKTTIIDLIKNDLGLVVISLDEIRHKMFEKKYVLSDKFREIVKATSTEMFKRVYQRGYSIVVDNNIVPYRIEEIKNFLESEDKNKHKLVSVYLQTSKNELIKRLNSREYMPGRYQGTVDELEGSMKKYGEIDESVYDVVLNTEELSAEEIANVVKNEVKLV